MAKGPNVGTAWVTIALESKGIKKDIEKELGPVGDEAEKQSKKAGQGLDSIGTKALAAATVAGAALFGLASAAGSLNAAMGTSERVFGAAADSVQAFAADTTDAVFLSESAALQAANGFGIFATQAGMGASEASAFSVEMVQMAADLAAVADVPVSQAVQDLTSAFAGSTETMQKYGINLNETELKAAYFAETGERITGVMTSQQKTMAVYWALLDKGAFAYGAAESEADQFASQVDRLKGIAGNVAADFGQPIVDFASGLLGSISGGAEQLLAWNTETGGMLATGLAAGIGIAAAGSAAVGIASKVKGAVDSFSDLSKGMKIATGALGGVALAVTAGFVAYGLMTQHGKELEAQTKSAGAALDVATRDAWELAEAAASASGDVDALAVAQSALGKAVLESFDELDPELLGQFGIQAEDLGATLLDLRGDPVNGLRELATAAGVSAEDAERLSQVLASFAENDNDFVSDDLSVYVQKLGEDLRLDGAAAQEFEERLSGVGGGLEDILDASTSLEESEIASVWLNQKVASGDLAESLVEQAEAQSEASRNGEDAFDVYTELLDIVSRLPPGEQAAAEEALGLATAHDTAAAATEDLASVSADTIDMITDAEDAFADAAEQADAFSSALDRLVGGQLSLQEARDELKAGYDDLAEVIEEAAKGTDGYSLSLDSNTEAGRDNRAMIRDSVQDILSLGDSMLEAGATTDTAAAAMRGQRSDLIALLTPFFETEQAAEDYINMLGLTPGAIDTAVELSGDEAAKQRIEVLQGLLGDIPTEIRSEIDAAIDDGDFAEAERLLNWVARDRAATVYANVVRGAGNAFDIGGFFGAYGGYVEGGSWENWTLGEAPWDEAVLTVGNMGNLRRQLEDDRIRAPIVEALDLEPQLVGGGGGGGGSPLVGEMNVYESRGESVEEQLARVEFLARFGG